MPEPISTTAAITTLALNGLGRLAMATVDGAAENATDRGIQSVLEGIRNRLAGMRDAPAGLRYSRGTRRRRTSASRGGWGTPTCRWSQSDTVAMHRAVMSETGGKGSPPSWTSRRPLRARIRPQNRRTWVQSWVQYLKTFRANHG